MSKTYLIEVSKWLNLFDKNKLKDNMHLTHGEAIYLRRLTKTNDRLPPEKVLDELIEMSLIETRIEGKFEVLFLSALSLTWIELIKNELDFQLLQEHKHYIARFFLKKWIIRPELTTVFASFTLNKNGQYELHESLFPDDLTYFKIKLLSFDILELEGENYLLNKMFVNLVTDAGLSLKITTEKQLLKHLENLQEIGLEGEKWVVEQEKKRLLQEFPQKTFQVDRVSEQNVSLGYDVYSIVEPFEVERCIEVKTSRSNKIQFYLTPNELAIAMEYGDKYWLYLLIGKKKNEEPERLYMVQNPAQFFTNNNINLKPCLFEINIDTELLCANADTTTVN